MPYVDGYVMPILKKNLAIYLRMSRKVGKLFIEHGALEFRECFGDELDPKGVLTFPAAIKIKPGETVILSWHVYKSKAHRNNVNAKVLKDPRFISIMGSKKILFDPSRIICGGFKTVVNL